VIYDNPWEWLGQVDVELPDEEQFWHHVVRLHRAAMMVLLDEQDRVLLPWRHRFVQDRWGWELPGGLIDEGEEPAETAARELEETGYRAGRVEHLITFQPMVGMVDSEHVVFVGRDVEKVEEGRHQGPGAGEGKRGRRAAQGHSRQGERPDGCPPAAPGGLHGSVRDPARRCPDRAPPPEVKAGPAAFPGSRPGNAAQRSAAMTLLTGRAAALRYYGLLVIIPGTAGSGMPDEPAEI